MAYPTIDAPYGFRPVNLLGGQVFAGSTRQMAIASGHATNIFFGDIVIMSANRCINNATLTDSAVQVAGIFMGCSYINSSSQRVFGQFYPATITQTGRRRCALLPCALAHSGAASASEMAAQSVKMNLIREGEVSLITGR